jgi:hypothetical protein
VEETTLDAATAHWFAVHVNIEYDRFFAPGLNHSERTLTDERIPGESLPTLDAFEQK